MYHGGRVLQQKSVREGAAYLGARKVHRNAARHSELIELQRRVGRDDCAR